MATLQTLPEATTLLPAGGNPGSASMAVRSFLYAVFKHRRLVLGVFLLVFLSSSVVALLRPPTYRASTKVMVKLGDTLQLAPAEAPSHSMFQPLTPEVVNTEAEIVKSRQVVETALERLEAAGKVKPAPGVSKDQLIDGLQLALAVTPTPSSNVLQISFLGRKPEGVKDVVNTITDVYLEHHNRAYRNDEGVRSFYSDQLRLLEARMKESQHSLSRYLRKNNIVDVDQEIRILNQDILEQQKTVQSHRMKLRGAEEKLVQLREQIARTPRQVPFEEEYQANPTLAQFRSKLAELEIERSRLAQIYLPTDRHVQNVEEQMEQLRGRLRQEQERVLHKQTLQENEIYRELQRNANTLEVAIADLRAREPSLVRRFEEAKKRLRDLRGQRFVVGNLKQEADQRGYAFDLYYRKREEARLAELMKNQSLVNVSVVERASTPLQPMNGIFLPLVLGMVGGLGLAAALAVAVEFVNRRLRFEEEVERHLELPVLAVIPDLETEPGLAKA
ncbi:MAG: Wzz/FepE/Etk N-terminal domain-containing protein [Candidatus Binatia bacterium]